MLEQISGKHLMVCLCLGFPHLPDKLDVAESFFHGFVQLDILSYG